MTRQKNISWPDVLDLRVVKALGELVARKWGLGLMFTDRHGVPIEVEEAERFRTYPSLYGIMLRSRDVAFEHEGVDEVLGHRDPSSGVHTSSLGINEVCAPVLVDRRFMGLVIAGGYLTDDTDPGTIIHRLVSRGISRQLLNDFEDTLPVLDSTNEIYLREILELAASEIIRFQKKIWNSERRPSASNKQQRFDYSNIIGKCQQMQDLFGVMDKVIDSDSTVLILGDNGTGKELIARAIHFNSSRKEGQFVVQNCSAFNDNLLDSELFGHKKGAFTGATSDKRGLFEVADGSTFFLDEIGEMSPSLQVKLLRVLQEGTFIPVGDTQSKKVDVRIIAATNRDLKQMVEKGEFREDLYYRINVINIRIPLLKERSEDVPLLVDHFLDKQSCGDRKKLKKLTKECLRKLYSYSWPGNIRELENEIERLVVLTGDVKLVGDELLSSRIREPSPILDDGIQPHGLPEAIQRLERKMISEVLRKNNWNKTRAALELRISRRNLIRKVNKYNLDQREQQQGRR